jgi:hypothetical protein
MAIGDKIGAFVVGTARLSRFGNLIIDKSNAPLSCDSVYAVILPRGMLATPTVVTGLPAINSAFGSVPSLRAENYTFNCLNENTGVWEVVVAYTRAETITTTQEDESFQITGRTWDVSESAVDLTADVATGAPLVNSAGDPFDSVPQRIVSSPKVSFTRKETRNPAAIIALNGTINEEAITVLGVAFPPHCAKLKVVVADSMDDTSGALRYSGNYEILGRNLNVMIDGALTDIGWDEAMIECGYAFLAPGSPPVKMKILEPDESGEKREVSSPKLLNADGTQNMTKTPVVRRVVSCTVADWGILKLPE